MSNSGFKKYNTLIQVNSLLVPTGMTKPNSPLDPDYIPPSYDITSCPLPTTTSTTTTTTLPSFLFNGANSSVFNNILTRLLRSSDLTEIVRFTLPNDSTPLTESYLSSSETSFIVDVYFAAGLYNTTIQVYEGAILVFSTDYTAGETHIEITGVNPNVEITVTIYVTPAPIATTTTTGGGS